MMFFLRHFDRCSSSRKIRIVEQGSKIRVFLYYSLFNGATCSVLFGSSIVRFFCENWLTKNDHVKDFSISSS